MLGNLSFTRRNLINFFVKNLTDWIFISNLPYFIIGVIVKMLCSMVCRSSQHAKSPYGKLGQAWLFLFLGSWGDWNNCDSGNWSTTGHKRKKREICCFYKDKFISWGISWTQYIFAPLCTLCVLFICVCHFQNFNILCIFYHLSFNLDCFIKRNGSSQCTLN